MIAHHAQALDMTALVLDGPDSDDRLSSMSDSDGLILLSKRISISQTSEIDLMQKWLRDRDQVVPEATAHQMKNGEHILMPGMLTPAQMSELAASSGEEFYVLFLDFMIGHHEGALVMVSDLMASVGSAQDTIIFRFATGVDGDQRMEIARMQDMIEGKY